MRLFLFAAVLLSVTDELWALEVCCPVLGCFSDAPPHNGLFLPQCPEFMGINSMLYTRENRLEGEEFSRTMYPPSFKAGRMLWFIVHGYTESEEVSWMHVMKDAALEKGDYNVVIVGWKCGSRHINYFQSAANTRTVGAEIALLAKIAIEKGVSSREDLYCVGHSLGAQVCGYAGNRLKFGRITGLDPGAVPFESRQIGLNPSSADFVDVIHTHGYSYVGIQRLLVMNTIGHVDFYPNGGQLQPGCELSVSTLPGLNILTAPSFDDFVLMLLANAGPVCHHMRAVYLYIESIRTPCFVARYSCSNQFHLPGSCSKSDVFTQNMGFSASPYGPRGIFYLTTYGQPPYCNYYY